MSINSEQKWKARTLNSQNSFLRNKDYKAWAAAQVQHALQALAEHHGHDRASTLISISSPVLEGVADLVEEHINPHDNHSAASFWEDLHDKTAARVRKDYHDPVLKFIDRVQGLFA